MIRSTFKYRGNELQGPDLAPDNKINGVFFIILCFKSASRRCGVAGKKKKKKGIPVAGILYPTSRSPAAHSAAKRSTKRVSAKANTQKEKKMAHSESKSTSSGNMWLIIPLGVIALACMLIAIGVFMALRQTTVAMPAQANAPSVSEASAPAAPANPEPVAVMDNDLVNPSLHHADTQPPENGVGSFDVGVKGDQIGIAFGWHIAWPKGGNDAGGNGCDLVILTPGWYENLQITDGRVEVYNVPSSDNPGWIKVLGSQRATEQAKDYGCPAKVFTDLPQWESPIPSPP